MMRDGGLREPDALLDISAAEEPWSYLRILPFFQNLQNPPPGRIGDGLKRPIERCVRRHDTRNTVRIDACQYTATLILWKPSTFFWCPKRNNRGS